MNGRKAKMLRAAAQYRNQSATPGVMDFPGVSRMVHVPSFAKHETTKTSYVRLPLDDGYTKVHTKVVRLVHGAGSKPILELNSDGTPKYDMVVLSKPGKLRAAEPKGVYRQLKKLSRRHGLFDFKAATLMANIERLHAEVEGQSA